MTSSITKRVLAYLKEKPGTPEEIGRALELIMRSELSPGRGYRWGRWSFSKAERDSLIILKDGKWHIKEAEGL